MKELVLFIILLIWGQTQLFGAGVIKHSNELRDTIRLRDDSIRARMLAKENSRPNIKDAIRFVDATAYTVTAPLRWDGDDWLKTGGVIAGTALTSLLDKPVRSFWQNRNSGAWDGIERAGFHLGKPYAAFILTGGFYLTGVALNNEWAKETGLILGAAYLTSGAIQTLMKTAVGRARPATNEGPWAFDPMSPEAGYHSFPSGHIQIAMVSALVLASRTDNPWLKSAFYATGGLTLISRMYSDSHWLSDMAFGTAISWFCTQAILKRMDNTHYSNPFNKLKGIQWSLAPTTSGLGLVGIF
ncbi:phosphatase PAP2 family protein [Albibacterium indicum]|uniref:phosphatase PAP2 family protein n=1 Tax=Albibacterium indicum TaxID=2292082 RepID=UPI000E4CF584|nr:phosphatase PAP2 family protein [Pedobacter indicus]